MALTTDSFRRVAVTFGLLLLSACEPPPHEPSKDDVPACEVEANGLLRVELTGDVIPPAGTTFSVSEESIGHVVLDGGLGTIITVDYPSVATAGELGDRVTLGASAFFGESLGYLTLSDDVGLWFEGGLVVGGPAGQRLAYSSVDGDKCRSETGNTRTPGVVSFSLGDGFELGIGETQSFALEGEDFVAHVVDAGEYDCGPSSADCGGTVAFAFVVRQ